MKSCGWRIKKKPSWVVVADLVTSDHFAALMAPLAISPDDKLAVAVSGGADSMALAYLLSHWVGSAENLIILTVDHALRTESADEVQMVKDFSKSIGVKCKIFKWMGDKPEKSIQEKAREARYEMMADYCQKQKISTLFLGHHGDDQWETFLFRLSKGSGIDGLSAMKPIQPYKQKITLARPLLSVSHHDLVETCRMAKINWVEDPSNESEKYMRGRMRASKKILSREGLSRERIAVLISRLERASDFIDQVIDKKEKEIIVKKETKRIEMGFSQLVQQEKETIIRMIQRCLVHLRPDKPHPARLEDIERLADRMNTEFRGATLGGVKFSIQKKNDLLTLSLE